MRSTSVYLALGFAPLALCVPVPLVLIDTIKPVISTKPASQHPATTVLKGRPAHALPQIINWGPDEDDADFETVIDNKPITPSADADPTAVLQVPRPIVTEYLMAISGKNPEEKEKVKEEIQGEEQQQRVLVLSPNQDGPVKPTEGEDDFISVGEMDIIVPVMSQRIKIAGSTPCNQQPKYLSREQSDMIIICLAVVFLFAVVLFETYGSFSS
ncbi:hypothetical protein V8F20_010024 [Naviculisporaceae sp. PSN 640]